MNAVHWIRETRIGCYPHVAATYCGLHGHEDGTNEWVTVPGNRFEAVEKLRGVTCKRCLKSAQRIAEK